MIIRLGRMFLGFIDSECSKKCIIGFTMMFFLVYVYTFSIIGDELQVFLGVEVF